MVGNNSKGYVTQLSQKTNLVIKSKICKIFSFEIANTPKNNPSPENMIPIPINIKSMIIIVTIEIGKYIKITIKNTANGIKIPKNSERI